MAITDSGRIGVLIGKRAFARRAHRHTRPMTSRSDGRVGEAIARHPSITDNAAPNNG
jgi:hypothetical protein